MNSRNYKEVMSHIRSLVEGETDEIAVMATICCELFHAFPEFSWVGFYRVVQPGVLKVGPYQGKHGCLTIPFDKGVCGKCAREGKTQLVDDVELLPYHIACSSSTRSEIVLPVFNKNNTLIAVLDIDSDEIACFGQHDQQSIESILSTIKPIL